MYTQRVAMCTPLSAVSCPTPQGEVGVEMRAGTDAHCLVVHGLWPSAGG